MVIIYNQLDENLGKKYKTKKTKKKNKKRKKKQKKKRLFYLNKKQKNKKFFFFTTLGMTKHILEAKFGRGRLQRYRESGWSLNGDRLC